VGLGLAASARVRTSPITGAVLSVGRMALGERRAQRILVTNPDRCSGFRGRDFAHAQQQTHRETSCAKRLHQGAAGSAMLCRHQAPAVHAQGRGSAAKAAPQDIGAVARRARRMTRRRCRPADSWRNWRQYSGGKSYRRVGSHRTMRVIQPILTAILSRERLQHRRDAAGF